MSAHWRDTYPALSTVLRLRGGPVHTAIAISGKVPMWWADPRKMLRDEPLSNIRRDAAIVAAGVTVAAVKRELAALRELVRTREAVAIPLGGRLYPLKDYDTVARRVWERRGRPKFGKKKISGVRWGGGKVEDNGKWGWDKCILARYLGCRISGGRLVLTCPD